MIQKPKWTSVLDVLVAITVVAVGMKVLFGPAWGSTNPDEGRTPAASEAKPAGDLPTGPISLRLGYTRGDSTAPVVIAVFSDYQCPACATLATRTLPELDQKYVATGIVQIIYKHLPLERLHPYALDAAKHSHCASLQGKFWSFHDWAFSNQKDLSPVSMDGWSRLGELNTDDYSRCRAAAIFPDVLEQITEAARLKVRATPTVFVGNRTGDRLHNATRLVGAVTPTRLADVIENARK